MSHQFLLTDLMETTCLKARQFQDNHDAARVANQQPAALAGGADESLFAQVYQDHYAAIAAYLYRRTGNVATAEDLAAEAFLAAFRSFNRYQDRGIPIRHWLYRIATRKVNKWVKLRKRQPLSLEVNSVQGKRPQFEFEDIEEALAALHSLSAKYQTVLTLHYLEELDLKTIACVLKCRLGTVKSRLSRAREALRNEIIRRAETK